MKQVNLDQWKTKAEAAQILGVSEKTVERMAERGELGKAERKIPGRRPLPVFDPDDIEKVQKQTLRPQPLLVPAVTSSKAFGQLSAHDARSMAAAMLGTDLAFRRLSPVDKLYLTIPEASEYTGLTQTFLRRLIKSGKLTALKDRGWKIRREDLATVIKSL